MATKNLYNESSIQSLSPLEFTRLRPGVYVGSTEYSTQLLIEIVSNAVDEFRVGHGNKIDVSITNDNIVTVRDNGQGFIVNSKRDDGKTVLEAAFSVLNTSGKYTEDGVYEGVALGLNGIGSKLVVFLSHWADVCTYRDGKFEKVSFAEGVFSKRETGKSSEPTGTMVTWKASEEFFSNPEVDISVIKKLFQVISCLCPGLTINLDYKGEKISYYSKNGISDLVNDGTKGKEIIKHRFETNFSQDKYKIDLVMTYTTNYSPTIVPYVNAGLTESGPHITQIKTLLTREFNKFFRDKKWIKDKEENLSGDDLQEGLYMVFNITAPGISYDAQTKSRVVKIDMKPFTQILADNLLAWCNANEKDAKLIADKALNARKAREAAKKARDSVRGKEKKKEKVLKFDSKLADAWSKDRSKCEIIVTEGDSASGNLKLARDNEFQAIMPVRGKILNVRKSTLAQIQKNAEIMTMIDAFGLSVDPKTMKLTYRREDLRYGKIIIMSDGDVDGSHIKNLFYTFIWTFCPKLIEEGYVYAGVPPRYKVTMGKDTYIYLKDDEALEEFKNKNSNKKFSINYLKGLGELSAEETTILVDPKERILNQITVEDVNAAEKLFDDLMGGAVAPRKKFIQEHSKEATYSV